MMPIAYEVNQSGSPITWSGSGGGGDGGDGGGDVSSRGLQMWQMWQMCQALMPASHAPCAMRHA